MRKPHVGRCGDCKQLFPRDNLLYSPSPTLKWLCPPCHEKWENADPLATIDNPEYTGELPNTCADCEKPLVLRGRAVMPDGKTICYACFTKRKDNASEKAA